jgi:transposase/DNA-binding MarR family transcriptional regulator
MELTDQHLARIAHALPRQRGNVRLSHRTILEAILYVNERGCAWRQLPDRFGNWHTIYTRMRRWSASGVLKPILDELRRPLPVPPARPRPAAPAVRDAGAMAKALPGLTALADELRPMIFWLSGHLKQERRQFRMSQFEVAAMMTIEIYPGTSIGALAARQESSPATMSVTVRRLAAQGWIEPAGPTPGDRRRTGLALTEAGREVLTGVRAGRSDQLVRQFAALDAADVALLAAALRPLRQVGEGLSQALPQR